MKGMVLTAPKDVSARDVGQPAPGDGKTLVRVAKTGICGTDLKIYQGGIPVDYPRIMGHESVGKVVSGGTLAPGTSVIVDPAYFCGTCFQCRNGQMHICPNGGLIGRDVDGGFAEYLVAPSDNVHALPDGMDVTHAPLIQPMTTCLHAQRLAKIFPGEAVIVIGLGVTGLLHVQLAKAHGAHPVIGITRSKWKRDLAEKLGADLTIDPTADVKAQVIEATGDRGGADLVIESVGQLSIVAQAIDLVRIGGRILPFGILTVTEGELPFYDLYFKEIQVVNARVAKPEDFPACIDFVQRGIVELGPLVTDVVPLMEMNTALDMLEDGKGIKIILDHAA